MSLQRIVLNRRVETQKLIDYKNGRPPKVDEWEESRAVPGSKTDPFKEQESFEKDCLQRREDEAIYLAEQERLTREREEATLDRADHDQADYDYFCDIYYGGAYGC